MKMNKAIKTVLGGVLFVAICIDYGICLTSYGKRG